MWKIIGRVVDSGDVTGQPTTFYQPVKFNKNIALRYFQTWFEIHNDPTFTSISFDVYSLSGSTPKKLLYSSTNNILKASIHALPYAVKGLRFDFGDVVFKDTDWYAFVPRMVGYAPTSTKFIMWKFGYPDPAYRLNVPLTSIANAGRSPYDIPGFVGAEL